MKKILEQMEKLIIEFYKIYNNYCSDNNAPVLPALDYKKQDFVLQLAKDFNDAHKNDAAPRYIFESDNIKYRVNSIYRGENNSDLITIYNKLCSIEGHKKITPTSPAVAAVKTFTTPTAPKLDLYKFTSKDEIHRPQMAGVYLVQGHAIATDAHTLIIAPASYPEQKENTIVGKHGDTIAGKYPRFAAACPQYKETEKIDITANYKTIAAAILARKCAVEAANYMGDGSKLPLHIAFNGRFCMNGQKRATLDKLLTLAKSNQVYLYIPTNTNTTAAYFSIHNKKTGDYMAGGIVMPTMPDDEIINGHNVNLPATIIDFAPVRETIVFTPKKPAYTAPAVVTWDHLPRPAAVAQEHAPQLPPPPAVVYVSGPVPPAPIEEPAPPQKPAYTAPAVVAWDHLPRPRRIDTPPATYRRRPSLHLPRVAACFLALVVTVVLSLSWPPVTGTNAAALHVVTLPEITVIDTAAPTNEPATATIAPVCAPQTAAPGTYTAPAVNTATNAPNDTDGNALDTVTPAPSPDSPATATTTAPAAPPAPCWYASTACYNSPAPICPPIC